MITQIYLENFKCFPTISIHPKQVTCFVGANGTGKSSVFQAFGLLKQSVEAVSISQGVRALSRGCDLKLKGPLVNVSGSSDLSWDSNDSNPEIFFAGIRGTAGTTPEFSHRVQISPDTLDPLPPLHNDSIEPAHNTLVKLKIIPAMRGLTLPAYKLGDDIVLDVAMEDGHSKREKQTATNLAYTQANVEKISPMLQRVTGTGLSAVLVPQQLVEVKSTTQSGSVNIVTEGFGTNSLIMLLLQLTSAERGATVMIEEPEIHLHPKAQAELAEVLTEVALEEDKQVIMTTHSEHITGRLLTLVAEGKLTPDDVAIYAFEKDEEGVCTAKDLKISGDGRIEGSIGDFFEVNLAEMNRMVKALESRTNQGG